MPVEGECQRRRGDNTLYCDFRKDAPVRYGALYNVPIHMIRPNPANPRKNFDEEALEELARSIEEVGILQPLVLVENGDGTHRIVAGERRWRAAEMAGLASVPALIAKLTPAQEAEIMLIENLQRKDLDPIEEAQAYRALLDEHGYTQERLAEKLGVSQPHIANRIRLLRLPETVQEKISRGIITPGHGRELVALAGAPEILEKAVETIEQNRVPVSEVGTTIAWQVRRHGRPLSKTCWPQPIFDTSGCEKCKSRMEIDVPPQGKEPFCLKPSCWERKQRAADKNSVLQKLQELAEEGAITREELAWMTVIEPYTAGWYVVENIPECESCPRAKKVAVRHYDGALEIKRACNDGICHDKKFKESYERQMAAREAEKEDLRRRAEEAVARTGACYDKQTWLYLIRRVYRNMEYYRGDFKKKLRERLGVGEKGNYVKATEKLDAQQLGELYLWLCVEIDLHSSGEEKLVQGWLSQCRSG